MSFELHLRLAADTTVVDDLELSRVLLSNDARYPWLILVPRQPEISEVYQLSAPDQARLWQEATQVGEALMAAFDAHKLNVAALGNQVKQLHIHVIARFDNDEAWPDPVWGVGESKPYQAEALAERLTALRKMLAGLPGSKPR